MGGQTQDTECVNKINLGFSKVTDFLLHNNSNPPNLGQNLNSDMLRLWLYGAFDVCHTNKLCNSGELHSYNLLEVFIYLIACFFAISKLKPLLLFLLSLYDLFKQQFLRQVFNRNIGMVNLLNHCSTIF